MGSKYEVEAYTQVSWGYEYQQVYYGDSLWDALNAMRVAKKISGSVRLYWR